MQTDYPDGGHRRTVVAQRYESTQPRQAFCVEGVEHCAFDYGRIRRNLDNERRKVSRARRCVEDYCRCNALDHLLTLTAGKHLGTRDDALGAWSNFLDDKRFGRWFRDYLDGCYVAVAEPFADDYGRHVHVAIHGRVDGVRLERLKSAWTAFLLRRLGIPRPEVKSRRWRVNVAAPKRGNSPKALGGYLGKYVGKAFDARDGGGRHRYRAGHGMRLPKKHSSVWKLGETQLVRLMAGYDRVWPIRSPLTGSLLGYSAERTPQQAERLWRNSPPECEMSLEELASLYGGEQMALDIP